MAEATPLVPIVHLGAPHERELGSQISNLAIPASSLGEGSGSNR